MNGDDLNVACWLASLDIAVCGERIVDIELDFDDRGLRMMRFEYADPFATESEDE